MLESSWISILGQLVGNVCCISGGVFDLVQACYDYKADVLVLGFHGIAQTLKEKLHDEIQHHLGSVPDYCLHHAPCDVIIVKPKEYTQPQEKEL